MTYSSCQNKEEFKKKYIRDILKVYTIKFSNVQGCYNKKKDCFKKFNNVKTNIYSCIHRTAQ